MLLEDYRPEPEPAQRQCGRRRKGGAYWKTAVGAEGTPIWKFLKDPPQVLDFAAMGLSAQGLKLIPDAEGVWHAWDWIGAAYWEFFPDYYEEGVRFGFSAFMPSNFDWGKLTPGKSFRKAVHPRGAVANAADLWPHRRWERCRTRQRAHTEQAAPWPGTWHCVGFLWELVAGQAAGDPDDPRRVRRTLDTFGYDAWAAPAGFAPQWTPAYVMDFPLTCIEIVRDPEGGRHAAQAARIDRANPRLPIAIVEE